MMYLFRCFAFVLFATAAFPVPLADTIPQRDFAHKCEVYSPPPAERINAIIQRSERIVFVKVKSFEVSQNRVWLGNNVVYVLDVITTLKGSDEPFVLRLPGVRVIHDFPFDPSLFDVTYRHANGLATAKTTDNAQTRRIIFHVADKVGYCQFAPYFDVGMTYLVLLGEPYTLVSFEPIVSEDDPWYERVRKATWDKKRSLYGEPTR